MRDIHLISIVIPAYNSENYIEECLKSVSGQTYKELEIIVVDNNSSDRTAEIIKTFSRSDERVKYVFCPVSGVSNARNAGIKVSGGEYVFFLDSDDSLAYNAMEIMYNAAKNNNLDIVACNILYSSEKSKHPMEKTAKSEMAKGDEISGLFSDMLPSYVWYMVFKLFKRSILSENGILFSDKLAVGEDLDFVIKVMDKSKAISFIDTPLYIYNISGDGLNLKYHENLYELKSTLFETVKAYLLKNERPLDNLYINLVNDVFALAVNEQKSGKPDFNRLLDCELTKELLKSDAYKSLGLSKKVFFFCLEHRFKLFLSILAKMWIK